MKTGIELIAAERERQIYSEGWSPKHDDSHAEMELSRAARCYASPLLDSKSTPGASWPWELADWKPSDDPVRNLVKAGALIAAEIDRINRARPQPLNDALCDGSEPPQTPKSRQT